MHSPRTPSAARPPKGKSKGASLDRADRRIQPRLTTQFRSTFSGSRKGGQGRTVDISLGGCKVESGMLVAQGDTLECRLHIPGLDWPLQIDEAKVRWVQAGTFGIGFTRMRSEEMSKLKIVLNNLHAR
jgi:hypothetical protein